MIINHVQNAAIPPHPQNNKWRTLVAAKLFALCALSLLLSACGGGGR